MPSFGIPEQSDILEMSEERISYVLPPLNARDIEAFRLATLTEHSRTPLTFVTYLRWAEFRWLERLKIDMQGLLHTEQEYEYQAPLSAGDTVRVESRVTGDRERRGMRFVTIETRVSAAGEPRLLSQTSFVVRTLAQEEK